MWKISVSYSTTQAVEADVSFIQYNYLETGIGEREHLWCTEEGSPRWLLVVAQRLEGKPVGCWLLVVAHWSNEDIGVKENLM